MICKSNASLHWPARSTYPEAKWTDTELRSKYDDPGNKERHPDRRKERTAENKSMEAKGENGLYNLQVSKVTASPESCESEESTTQNSMCVEKRPNVELHMLAKLAIAWNFCSLWPRQIVCHRIRSVG